MTRTAALLAVGFAFAAGATADDAAKSKASSLEGTYTIVSGERDGKPLPEDRFKGSMITFKGNKVFGTDKDKKEFFASTFTLDTSATPHKIMMTSVTPKEGEKTGGVVKTDGDTVTLCYALPGGENPTDFKTKEKQNCFVLQKTAAK